MRYTSTLQPGQEIYTGSLEEQTGTPSALSVSLIIRCVNAGKNQKLLFGAMAVGEAIFIHDYHRCGSAMSQHRSHHVGGEQLEQARRRLGQNDFAAVELLGGVEYLEHDLALPE